MALIVDPIMQQVAAAPVDLELEQLQSLLDHIQL
jgi:hypothetical protein